MTQSMRQLIQITEYRRARQEAYNQKHGITPQSVRRAVQESLHTILRGRAAGEGSSDVAKGAEHFNLSETLRELEEEMKQAAAQLEYERAALLRDQIRELKSGAGLEQLLSEPARSTGRKSGWKAKGGQMKKGAR